MRKRLVIGLIALLLVLVLCVLIISLNGFQRAKNVSSVARCKAELATIEIVLPTYRTNYNAFPTGDHIAVMKTLRGANPGGIYFLEVSPRSLSKAGEFLDPWRVPYRFEFGSNGTVRVSSSGPNQRFGDDDDISTQP